jgi:hypothetical protein
MLLFACQDIPAIGSLATTGTLWLFFVLEIFTLKFGWPAVAKIASEKGAILTLFTVSCRMFLLETGAILEVSKSVTSDWTAAAMIKLLERLQSAASNGFDPQSKLKMG